MILYTIYPEEMIFQNTAERKLITMNVDDKIFVMEIINGQAQIVRLISSDPQDYLNPNWQPGTKLGFTIPDK